MGVGTTFKIEPVDATFGAVVTGVRLAELDEAGMAALYEAWLEYALLIFPGQHLDREAQIAFARRLGTLEFDCAAITNVRDGKVHAEEDHDVVKLLRGNEGWHTDSTYMPVQAKGAVFTAHVTPSSGGETGFADMRAAYDALDPATRARIETLSAYHSIHYSQGKMGQGADYGGYGFQVKEPPLRPLVKVHPETGRKCLLIGRHAYGVQGLSPEESERLLEDLADFACQPPRVWRHSWTPGDAILWDNRCLMHRSYPWDLREPRIMYHSRIAGHPVTEFAAHA